MKEYRENAFVSYIEIIKKYKTFYVFKDEANAYGICIPLSNIQLKKGMKYKCNFMESCIMLHYNISNEVMFGNETLSYESYPSSLEEINKRIDFLKKLF